MDNSIAFSQADEEIKAFIVKVYHWMTVGLVTTGAVAWSMSQFPDVIHQLLNMRLLFYGLLIAELAAVVWLSGWVHQMSVTTASVVFFLYAAMNGVTISLIFLIYTKSTIFNAFFITAGTFGFMSVYGYVTKTDLGSLGNLCFMGLIGIILASVANWFIRSSQFDWIITYIAVLVFVGLTAYDTQKIKGMYVHANEGTEEETKEAIFGALRLYLDFINLFLQILKIMGKRRD